jgi:hypothetical protein
LVTVRSGLETSLIARFPGPENRRLCGTIGYDDPKRASEEQQMIGFLIVLASAAGDDFLTPPSHLPSRAEAKAAVVHCGLPAKGVSVQFDREMDEDDVRVSPARGPISDQKLSCIKLYSRLEYAADVAHGRDWLRARNHLAGLPLPKKGEPLSNYAQAVEAFCGVKKGNLLVAADAHFITFTKQDLGQVTPRGVEHATANETQFECVMSATSAADLQSRGIGIGLATHPGPAAR